MWTLLIGLAWPCDIPGAIRTLETEGQKEAYDCVITSELAINPLTDAWDVTLPGEARDRLSRAMALYLLQQVDGAFNPMIVARLNPADRRLLADGVYARRGRASPAPEHAKVFAQFGWYKPHAGYTDGRLRPEDRANILLADRPPDPPAPLAATVAETPSEPLPIVTPPAADPGLCGCAAVSGAGTAGLWLVGLLGLRRARRRG